MIRLQYNESLEVPRFNVIYSRDAEASIELGYVEVYKYPDNCAGFINSFSDDRESLTSYRMAIRDVPLDRALNVVISVEDTPVAMP